MLVCPKCNSTNISNIGPSTTDAIVGGAQKAMMLHSTKVFFQNPNIITAIMAATHALSSADKMLKLEKAKRGIVYRCENCSHKFILTDATLHCPICKGTNIIRRKKNLAISVKVVNINGDSLSTLP
jgi:Zn finger protein HypA/HybF involved in hydrogenase expression